MKIRLIAPAVALVLLAAGCSSGGEVVAEASAPASATAAPSKAPAPKPTPTPAPTTEAPVAPVATPAPEPVAAPIDLSTDAALCAADGELSNLELNDALAPLLGFPADGDERTPAQDDAIRAHKNDAFTRECPARAS